MAIGQDKKRNNNMLIAAIILYLAITIITLCIWIYAMAQDGTGGLVSFPMMLILSLFWPLILLHCTIIALRR